MIILNLNKIKSKCHVRLMTIRCPFNRSHVMPIESLLKHIPKCTAINKANFAHCKYNQMHILLKEILDIHYEQCPDKPHKKVK